MRNVALGIGLPLVLLGAAFLPVAMAEEHVSAGYEEHARRLKTQASHSSDVRLGWARVTTLIPLAGEDSPDAVEGEVRWVGPFGVTVLNVEIAGRSSQSDPSPIAAAMAWASLLVAIAAGPAFVVWREIRS